MFIYDYMFYWNAACASHRMSLQTTGADQGDPATASGRRKWCLKIEIINNADTNNYYIITTIILIKRSNNFFHHHNNNNNNNNNNNKNNFISWWYCYSLLTVWPLKQLSKNNSQTIITYHSHKILNMFSKVTAFTTIRQWIVIQTQSLCSKINKNHIHYIIISLIYWTTSEMSTGHLGFGFWIRFLARGPS